jgi:hypothetical protein
VQLQTLALLEQARLQTRENVQLNDAFRIWASGELRSPPALK